jgi:hypothetical protein
MVKPERGSVLKRTMETEEKPCLHKKRGYWVSYSHLWR